MKRSLLIWILFIVVPTAHLTHSAQATKPSGHGTARQEILILNSYHPGYSWSDNEQDGIIDVFQAKDKNWVPVIEYLDLRRLSERRHLTGLKQLFRLKYQNKKFSVVIAMDNPALEFAVDNQAELFRNAPIVFCGINNYTPSLLKGRPDVTGIVEAIDIAGTIEAMLRLHPAAREIFIPNDYTMTGLAVRKEMEALVPRFAAKVRFRFTDPLTMEELLKELDRLPKDTLVLEVSFITDKTGRTFGVSETTRLFFDHSPVPIYSTYQQRLGFGIVGGKLLSARIHGTSAARIALRVLAGEKASAIPVVFESDSQLMFDYKVMNRFGIPLSALPEDSTVINKPAAFYATHRVVIQTALGIIGILTMVIFLLVVIVIQRRRSAIVLCRSEENFRRSLDDSPLGVRIVTEEGETIYANRVMLDIYGFGSLEELNTIPIEKRYTAESHAEFRIRREKRKQGDDVPSEYDVSIVRKDGEVRRLRDFRKEILWDGKKQFQVIYQDITQNKRAEEALKDREEELSSIYDNAPLVMLLVDKEWTIRKTNAFTSQFVGSAVGDMINLRCGESLHCIHSLDAPEGCGFGPSCGECTLRLTAINTIETGQGHHEVEARMSLSDGEKKREAIFLLSTARLTIKGQPMALVSMLDITERKRVEEALHASREQLRALAGRLQAVREEERTNMAREIHDELGGALTGLKIDFSFLVRAALKIENEAVRTSLLSDMDSMVKSIDTTVQTVRRIAMELRPGVLDDLGLVAALEWQLKDFEKHSGIRCELIPPVEDISLNAGVSTALFRIVQEALTNVVRHSGATEVRVRLRADAESDTLEVEDNGKGIEKEKTLGKASLGLLGMRERVQMFGGRITVTGTPGTGTKVMVEIPLAEKRKMDREGDAG